MHKIIQSWHAPYNGYVVAELASSPGPVFIKVTGVKTPRNFNKSGPRDEANVKHTDMLPETPLTCTVRLRALITGSS